MIGIGPKIDLKEKLTTGVIKGAGELGERLVRSGGPDEPGIRNTAEGAGLRELHTLLIELDPSRTWGGLRRVLTPSGDTLWLCPTHYREYDPGLPVLPPPSPGR